MNSFTDNFTINGITLTAQPICRQSEVLTPDALAFVAKLHNATAGRREELLRARRARREQIAAGQDRGSSAKQSPSATIPIGGSLRRHRGWRTAAWKSPGPWTRR